MTDKFNGLIEKIFIKYNEKARRNSISIINNGNFYGLGLHNEKFVKVGDVVLKEGMTVSFEYTDGQYKNVVLDTLKIVQQEIPKEVKKAMKDEDLPMRFGNAINVATFLTKSKLDIVAIAKKILPMIDDLRDKLASKYPNMTEKGVGSRCGQCVLIAAQYTANIDDFIGFAEDLFEEICQAEEELKNVSSNVQENKKENKVKTEKVVSKVEETKPEQVMDDVVDNATELDWDNDIPFAPIGLQYPQMLNCM